MRTPRTAAAIMSIVVLVGLAACGGGDSAASDPGSDPGSGAGSGSLITMKGFAFSPKTLTVAPGATIEIKNEDTAIHDLVDKKAGMDSGDVKGGGSGTVTAPSTKGTYEYICTYHPNMAGTLTVS